MLYVAFGLMVVLMHRLGLFSEWERYKNFHLLDEHIMQTVDDADWEDRMNRFRGDHPALQNQCWMGFSRRT